MAAAHGIARILESVGEKSYDNWSACLKTYLLSQDLWDLIESPEPTTSTPPQAVAKHDNEIAATDTVPGDSSSLTWRRQNAAALHAIQISLGSDILHEIREISSAKEAWNALADMHQKNLPKDEPGAGADQQPVGTAGPITESVESRYSRLMMKHIKDGDTEAVLKFLRQNPESIRFQFRPGLGAALHAAASLGDTEMVEAMMKHAKEEDMAIQNAAGSTVLHIAASSGHRRMVELFVNKNPGSVTLMDKLERIPLREACGKNHKELATFLYRATPFRWLCEENDGKYGANILKCCILGQMFDIALDMVARQPSLSTTRDADNGNAVFLLASNPAAFPSGTQLPFLLRWVYSLIQVRLPGSVTGTEEEDKEASELIQSPSEYEVKVDIRRLSRWMSEPTPRPREDNYENWCTNRASFPLKVTGTQHIYDLKRAHVCSLELLDRTCRHISKLDTEKLEGAGLKEAFDEAIKNGIVEFVKRAVKTRRSLLYRHDKDGKNIFMSAVEFRQENIFNLMYPLPNRATIVSAVDKYGNTLLHMAGKLSPSAKLSQISGAALQMQRELQWFQEVERVVNPMYKEKTNNDKETARQIFTRTHKDLAAAGEKWMKETASSYAVVGALIIIIVMLKAAFTVPGGKNEETGNPFKIFKVSDAISLSAAFTSVIMFLAIRTSRYAEADFLWSLPTKLVIGLSSLFVSIAAMMVTFCATVVIVLDRQLEYVVPIVSLATLPVMLFMLFRFPLLVEIFRSTYGSGIFERKMKRWV